MASRWMQAKLMKMAQARKLALAQPGNEPSKHRGGHTLEVAAAKAKEAHELCAGYTGVVTVCEPADVRWRQDVGIAGKTGRAYDRRTYGNGERRVGLDMREVQSFEYGLYRGGVRIA